LALDRDDDHNNKGVKFFVLLQSFATMHFFILLNKLTRLMHISMIIYKLANSSTTINN